MKVFARENVRHLSEAGSTNDEAFRLLGDGDHLLIWTTNQKKGRGSRGRSWLSPKGVGLALTMALDCGPWPHPTTLCYPLFAGVWLHDALKRVLPQASFQLKWPNDVLLDGRKLAGILCESRLVGNNAKVAIGIGVNLRDDPSLQGLDRSYATLAELPFPVDPSSLIEALRETGGPILTNTSTRDIRSLWLERCGLPMGVGLRVKLDGQVFDGCFDGLDLDGSLRLKLPHGQIKIISQAVEGCSIKAAQ